MLDSFTPKFILSPNPGPRMPAHMSQKEGCRSAGKLLLLRLGPRLSLNDKISVASIKMMATRKKKREEEEEEENEIQPCFESHEILMRRRRLVWGRGGGRQEENRKDAGRMLSQIEGEE